jgi:hypothetical protein
VVPHPSGLWISSQLERAALRPQRAVGQLLRLQTGPHTIHCDLQDCLDVDQPSGWEIIEVSQAMLEVSPSRRILDREPHLLQRHSAVIVLPQHIDARLLKCAEQTPLPGRFIVLALAITSLNQHGSREAGE